MICTMRYNYQYNKAAYNSPICNEHLIYHRQTSQKKINEADPI